MEESQLAARIADSFNRQGLMRTLGARLADISRGRVVVEVPFADTLTQQNGYFHAAVSAAIADSAGGYAALTTMEADDDVLAVEFKINLVRPAVGERLTAEAVVLKEGRTLTVCQSTVRAWSGAQSTVVAVMMQTNMRVREVRRQLDAPSESGS